MTEKTRQKYHQKGIFTVTQLSYTYRPRRRRGGAKHDYALKALAIRKNQVHLIGKVAFSTIGTPTYIDVEGDPDRNFYYCIGLRIEAGGLMTQRSYWADTPADEGRMWADCLLALSTIECPRLIHYGSYETNFLRQMKKRYPNIEQAGLLDQLMTSAVNLVSIIYPRIYFPTYSNGLKDIASRLGFRWSEPTASGAAALRWRRQWELSRALEQKQILLTYNAEDCAAAQMVAEALLTLSQCPSRDNASVVDVTTLKREYPQRFGKIEFVRPEFEQINNAARWDHQREKVYVRSSKLLRRLQGMVPKNKACCSRQQGRQVRGAAAYALWQLRRNDNLSIRTTQSFCPRPQTVRQRNQALGGPVFLSALHLLAVQINISSICASGEVWQHDLRICRLPNR